MNGEKKNFSNQMHTTNLNIINNLDTQAVSKIDIDIFICVHAMGKFSANANNILRLSHTEMIMDVIC